MKIIFNFLNSIFKKIEINLKRIEINLKRHIDYFNIIIIIKCFNLNYF